MFHINHLKSQCGIKLAKVKKLKRNLLKKSTKAKTFIVTTISLSLLSYSIAAEQWSLAPFALYEQAQEKIVVDGVSTKYGLGVVGGQITYQCDQNLSLTARAGYGQNDEQAVSFSGAHFNGKVTGTYFEASATTRAHIPSVT